MLLKKGKCSTWKLLVNYLAHHIDAQGIHTVPGNVVAIIQAPTHNMTEFRSFLGMVNYYGKLIPNLAIIVHP